jgi:hypothetical protein
VEKNRGERRRLEAENRKFDEVMEQIRAFAEQRAVALGLQFDRALAGGDDVGVAVVLNFNRKDAEICEAGKITFLVERLGAMIESQPEIVDEVEPNPS